MQPTARIATKNPTPEVSCAEDLLRPAGARRDLAGILAAAERGRQVMASQSFEILNLVADGSRVAVEFR